MSNVPHPRRPWAVWYEKTARPGWVLVALAACLYAPFLGGGFVIDDHRVMRLLGDYEAGRRETLGLYDFLPGGERNRAIRAEGWYPWWMGDDVRYRHFRPVAEWALYGQFQLFGDSPLGYRAVSLFLYMTGVVLALRFFRAFGGTERRARWAALVFALVASHAIPVVFLSAQGDVVGLCLAAGAALSVGRFLRVGGALALISSAVCFALGLGFKEAVLPVALAPLILLVGKRAINGARRRALVATAVLGVIGVGWLGLYATGGFGSNLALMLDPVGDPVGYLTAMPGRVLVLLTSWLIPLNPFLFYLHPAWRSGLYVYAALGAAALLLVGGMFRRHHRGEADTRVAALWCVPFLPLLACTVPDDRVMILPSLGLAYLASVWMTRPRADGTHRLRVGPLLLFVMLQVVTTLTVAGMMGKIERDSARLMRAAASGFGRPLKDGDRAFFLNAASNLDVLFSQDCFQWTTGVRGAGLGFLSDVRQPRVSVVDGHTIRIEATADPLFSTFVGLMGQTRDHPRRVGDVLEGGGFVGCVIDADADGVKTVELRFDRRLDSDAYRFYLYSAPDDVRRWAPRLP